MEDTIKPVKIHIHHNNTLNEQLLRMFPESGGYNDDWKTIQKAEKPGDSWIIEWNKCKLIQVEVLPPPVETLVVDTSDDNTNRIGELVAELLDLESTDGLYETDRGRKNRWGLGKAILDIVAQNSK